jgi:hypothetical protein
MFDGSLVAALRPLRGLLARLGLVIFIGSSLALALGLLYPVQRSLDLGRYGDPSYRNEVQGVFPEDTGAAVIEALGSRSCLIALWRTDLTAGSVSAGPTELDAVSPECTSGVSRFPFSTRVAHAYVGGSGWLDVGADAARALNVWTGSHVNVDVGPGIEPVALTVRDIYAVRATGSAFAAMAPAEVLFAHLPTGTEAGYSIGLTDLAPSEVEARLSVSPVRSELERAKGYPPIIVSEGSVADTAAEFSTNSLGLVRTIGALAAIGVVLMVLREFDVFRRRSERTISVIYRLGGSLMASVMSTFAAAIAVSAVAITSAILFARFAYSSGWLASCFPPDLEGLALAVWSGAVISSALWAVAMARLTYRHVGA